MTSVIIVKHQFTVTGLHSPPTRHQSLLLNITRRHLTTFAVRMHHLHTWDYHYFSCSEAWFHSLNFLNTISFYCSMLKCSHSIGRKFTKNEKRQSRRSDCLNMLNYWSSMRIQTTVNEMRLQIYFYLQTLNKFCTSIPSHNIYNRSTTNAFTLLCHNRLSIFSLNRLSSFAIFLLLPRVSTPAWGVAKVRVFFSFVRSSGRVPKSSRAVDVGFSEATRTSLYFVWT